MSIFNNAISGINASAAAINVLSQNTANSMVPDYTRKRVDLVSDSNGGVLVDSVQRMTDQFKVANVWHTQTELQYQNTRLGYSGMLEKIISQPSASLSAGMSELTNAISAVAEQPTSQAGRQGIINQSANVVAQIQQIRNGIEGLQQQNESELKTSTAYVNTLLDNINKLNQRIGVNQGNDAVAGLQDQRDGLINSLAGMVGIRVNTLKNGMVNISLNNGQPLVATGLPAHLSYNKHADSPLVVKFGSSSFGLNQDIGGKIAGLLVAKQGPLVQAQTYLDEFSNQLSTTVNSTLAQGFDLKGQKSTEPMFVYNAKEGAISLQVNPKLTPEKLALSSQKDQPGNSDNVKQILSKLQQPIAWASLNSTQSLTESYSSLISDIGSLVNKDKSNTSAAKVLHTSAVTAKSSISGVNLNEEAANLMLYQRVYQANAKVFSVADKLFDSVLSSL